MYIPSVSLDYAARYFLYSFEYDMNIFDITMESRILA